MIDLYEVQTLLGTHRKTFQGYRNALRYKMQLANECGFDEDYIEIYPYKATTDEFIYTDIED